MKNTTKILCMNGIIAALYVVLCLPFGVLTTSSGLQFRPAEALTVLPFLMPYTIWGLAVGCAISNIVSVFGIADILLGSLVTLIAGFLTSKLKKLPFAILPPILLNALILPVIWLVFAGQAGYMINMLSLLLTQTAVIVLLGVPLNFFVEKQVLPALNLN